VNFDLDDAERALADGIREVSSRAFPLERIRALEDTAAVDREGWRALGAAGVFALRLPEPEGVGLGLTQAAVVFEELGRALVPGPLVASHLAAGLVPGAAEGERVVGLLEAGRTPLVVEHLAGLDALVVLDGDGLRLVDPAALAAAPLERPLDPLTPLHLVEDLPAGDPVGGAELARRWRRDGAVLVAALLVGIAAACTERAVCHARERRQFGRPIGSFQAVKHLCADMLVRAEVARAALHRAAVLVDGAGEGDVARAVAGAALLAAEAAVRNGKDAVQVHGGMGYTWELDVHLFLKRAVVLSTCVGGPDEQAEAVARCLA
jgi:alkylation response protein AidB-like acyl-CoA dehydrogenase